MPKVRPWFKEKHKGRSMMGKGKRQLDPAQFIKQQIRDFIRTNPVNRLSFIDGYAMWADPVVRFADGDDPIFTVYKKIISPNHLTPREALAKAYNKNENEMPQRLSVISWVLPIAEATRKSNRTQVDGPSRLWSHTRWHGEKSNEALRAYVVEMLTKMGYMATAPTLQPYFQLSANENGLYSNWSERHIAYAAGHGTFSLSDGFITEVGIAHRCGSVVTNLILPTDQRTAQGPYSNCLFYQGTNCRACIDRCPAGAITEKGHDKNKCGQYMTDMGYSKAFTEGYDNDTGIAGCGLCQTKVPCEFRNPMNQKTRKDKK